LKELGHTIGNGLEDISLPVSRRTKGHVPKYKDSVLASLFPPKVLAIKIEDCTFSMLIFSRSSLRYLLASDAYVYANFRWAPSVENLIGSSQMRE
jgi:hypothetical protein